LGLFPPKVLLDADFIKILRLVEKIMVEGWIFPHPPGGCTPEGLFLPVPLLREPLSSP